MRTMTLLAIGSLFGVVAGWLLARNAADGQRVEIPPADC